MAKYETMLITSCVDEEVMNKVNAKFKALIEANGTIDSVDEWGKKKLAYEIQKMNEGYYYFIHFEAEPTAPRQIEDRIRIVDDVLRFLCVSQEEA